MPFIGQQPASVALTSADITDGIISNAKLAQDIISADTALGATPADTDEFLVSDAGVLKRMDYSHIKAGAGVLQVKTTPVTTMVTVSGSSGSWADLSEMAVSITPTLATSKILVILNASLGVTVSGYAAVVRLMRDSTPIGVSTDATGNQTDATFGTMPSTSKEQSSVSAVVLDAPASTSAISYNLEWFGETGTTVHLNAIGDDSDASYHPHQFSSITAIEIAVGVL